MSELRFKQAARLLFEAHERLESFAPLPAELAPSTEEQAYAIQDAFVALRAQQLGAIVGYKIALSSAEMRRYVGVERPQAGAMLESTIRRTPASVRAAEGLATLSRPAKACRSPRHAVRVPARSIADAIRSDVTPSMGCSRDP